MIERTTDDVSRYMNATRNLHPTGVRIIRVSRDVLNHEHVYGVRGWKPSLSPVMDSYKHNTENVIKLSLIEDDAEVEYTIFDCEFRENTVIVLRGLSLLGVE